MSLGKYDGMPPWHGCSADPVDPTDNQEHVLEWGGRIGLDRLPDPTPKYPCPTRTWLEITVNGINQKAANQHLKAQVY